MLLLNDGDVPVSRAAAMAIVHLESNPLLANELAARLDFSGIERKNFIKDAQEFVKQKEKSRQRMHTGFREDPGYYVSMFVDALKFGRGPIRREAIRHLSEIGPPARPAVPLLQNAISDCDVETRYLASTALKHIAVADSE